MRSFPNPEHWLAHRVSYGETDTMGVVYHAEYLHLFERGRNAYLRQAGIPYKEVEARGFFSPVRQASCRYRQPIRYDDLVWIRTGISLWGRLSFTFIYEIHDEERKLLHATGSTELAMINKEGRPVPVPAWFREFFP